MNSKKTVKIGNILIGGKSPIIIQSMTNTSSKDIQNTLKQINELYEAGCEIVRIAYPNASYGESIKNIIKQAPCPIIVDIHFDYKLAINAIEMGAAKIRINPGNIAKRNLIHIINAAKSNNTPIRIGVNSGSLEKHILEKYKYPTPEALVESALDSIRFFEDNNFENIIISIKSSDVLFMIKANMLLKEKVEYPIHLGVTEAGGVLRGSIKSSIGIGYLLINGVGDTIRISLSDNPVKEIESAKILLKSLHMYKYAPDIIACPTCSRSTFDVIETQKIIEEKLKKSKKDIKIAIMGCVVNGPGEAKDADLGITGSGDNAVLFKKRKIIFKGNEKEAINRLLKEVDEYGQ